jgi:hypothetical protein
VAGDAVEWEAAPYFLDAVESGRKAGLLLIGYAASAEPGSAEVARWMKTFLPEVPVEWLPTREPFWVPD